MPETTPTSDPLGMSDPLRRETLPVLLATLIFGVLWLWQVRVSEGFLEADACTHYLIARFAFDEPYRFVDVWGRPFKTLIYAGPAYLGGRLGVQATSLVLALVCAFVAMLVARDLGVRRPSLAFAFTLGIPLLFLHAFSELTELPFAALLIVSFYLYTRRQYEFAALLAGLLPLARPEGFGFLALAAVGLACHRRWFALLVMLPLGLGCWSYLGWEAYGRDGPYAASHTLPAAIRSILTWVPRHWPYAGESVYTEATRYSLWNLAKFTLTMPAVTGPAVFPALLLGLAVCLRRPFAGENRTRTLALSVPAIVWGVHSMLYFMGKMASNGELRYMLVVAPFWAVICALGWQRGTDLLGRRDGESMRFAGYACVVPLFFNTHVYTVLPLRFDSAWETTRFVAHWADRYGRARGRPAIMAAHPGVFYFLDRSNNDGNLAREFVERNIKSPPPGTILLYDPVYARFNAARDRRVAGTDEITAAGWIEHPTLTIGGWRVFLSPKPVTK